MSFGRESGPRGDPRGPNLFHLRPPSRPSTAVSSFRGPGAQQRFSSPPASFGRTHLAPNPYRAVGVSRPADSAPVWGNGERLPMGENDDQTHSIPSAVTSLFALHSSETSVTARIAQSQEWKRTRSPPLDANVSRYSSQASRQSHSNAFLDNRGHPFPPRTRSPSSAFENNASANDFHSTFGEAQRPALSPSAQNNHANLPASNPNLLAHQDQSLISPYVASYDYRRSTDNVASDMQESKRTRSPPIPFSREVPQEHPQFVQNNSRRTSVSPPRLGIRSNVVFSNPDSQFPQSSLPAQSNDASTMPKTATLPVSKRTRSPPLRFSDEAFQANSSHSQDDTERELQAKAKRLARFKGELSAEMRPTDIADQNISTSRYQRPIEERKKLIGQQSTESTGNFIDGNASSDFEGLETSSIIIGLCPDMCPESERAERERKGDLDQYERLDGDRNQTSKFLAIKKYNRTAERDSCLIRPMPVLQKTIDYLLNLLDQPYDDRFLGIYNFLWDRMRAIRMDLRMQHIFDQEAIIMLEQMIRLHIIAMHELCEYTKGEGFSEGFDAHLNIEQMNKTSVELFQMYDDHRKKGINMHTEKEFRGYYALLKLDKHPGYKVEPAELSLDLAKMTPEIRQTPEVLFARDVARACRTGNFVAFFRLARKASYLQACLMHAHFAKLRTQALACLHSSLQNNQGLPVIHVARWLGMEEEDLENLVEYHGFLIREFEEPYMVKEGPFLNAGTDYPTKCSRLVHLKRSKRIVEDVSDSCQRVSFSTETTKRKQQGKIYKDNPEAALSIGKASTILATVAEMPDSEIISSPKVHTKVKLMTETSIVDQQTQQGHYNTGDTFSQWSSSLAHSSPRPTPATVEVMEKVNSDTLFSLSPERKRVFGTEGMPSQIMSKTSLPERSLSGKYNLALETAVTQSMAIDNPKSPPERSSSGKYGDVVENSAPQSMAVDHLKSPPERSLSAKHYYTLGNSVPKRMDVNELGAKESPDIHQEIENEEVMANGQDEVAEAKLKLILRLWRRRSAKLKELREQRQLAAEMALSTLSLGLTIRPKQDLRSKHGKLDFDHVMRERNEKHDRSWSRLNVSDVVAGTLSQRNRGAKCLCWKIVLCSQLNRPEGGQLMQNSPVAHLEAGPWVLSKLMPPKEENDNDLIVSHPGLSIWKKWFSNEFDTDLSCCLSVIKNAKFDDLNDTIAGVSAVMFLVSESIPWTLQKVQLHNLLMSIPTSSCLPLLVLSGSISEAVPDPSSMIVNELGLHDIDKSRISSFLVVFLAGNQQLEHSNGFFCDKQLRKGLQWLASESPLQPSLHGVKARELVMSQLSPSMELLNQMSDCEVGPNKCVSVFNEALDWSLKEIAAAAKANPTNWPCTEIMLLEDSSDEHLMVKWHLPTVGWSSKASIAPLEGAIRDCKLSSFLDDFSWLHRGSSMVEEIEDQRLQLENCLIRYLTQSSKIMGVPLATKEACVMLQRSTRLELRNLSYYLVPNWVSIFQRIFNWRLMNLSTGTFSSAYVLECNLHSELGDLEKMQLEDNGPLNCFSYPSIDEIINISCSPLKSQKNEPEQQDFRPKTVSCRETEAAASASIFTQCGDSPQNGRLATADGFSQAASKLNNHDSQIVVAGKAADNLSSLLERCSILQNGIGEKLSVYF